MMKKSENLLKLSVVVSYIFMILINVLSFVFPFNGNTMIDILRYYPVLFAPAKYTHLIWGAMYGTLFAFVIYQLDIFGTKKNMEKEILYYARIVSISICLLNAIWILAWQYDYLALTVMIIFTTLITLKVFGKRLSVEYFTVREKILIRLPFSIYYALILITTVSNILVLLDSVRWKGWGISEVHWIIIVIIIVTSAVGYRAIRNKDLAFCFTIIWTYIGMLIRHTSPNNLDKAYPSIIFMLIISIFVLISTAGYLLIYKKKRYTLESLCKKMT